MLVDLTKLLVTDGMVSEFDYKLPLSSELTDFLSYDYTEIAATGKIINRASAIFCEYSVKASYNTVCDRCTKDMTNTFTFDCIQNIVKADNNDEYSDDIVLTGYNLELDNVIIDSVILNEPHKNLCKEDCKGICFNCGSNLNETECSCNKKTIDPRLEKLSELLKN